MDDGRSLRNLSLGEQAISALAFGPHAHWLAAADIDGTVAIWDLAAGTPAHIYQPGARLPIFHLAFSPDGRRLAGVDRAKVRIWEPAGGREVMVLWERTAELRRSRLQSNLSVESRRRTASQHELE